MSVVDTGWKSGPEVIRQAVADLATGSRTRRIVITHAHPDHVRGLAELAARTGADVLVHHGDAAWLDSRPALQPDRRS